MDYKKKFKFLSKAIKKIFSCLNSSSTSINPSKLYGPNSACYYECPCAYHNRQREEYRRRLAQHHQNTADEFHAHDGRLTESYNTGILLISNGTKCENKDFKEGYEGDDENRLSLRDRSRSFAKVFDDVDERAERFIKEFREQLRIQKVYYEKEHLEMLAVDER